MWHKIRTAIPPANKGQTIIEALLVLPLAGACFIVCLLFFHVYAQYLWMDHHLYQALICLAKEGHNCKDNMTQKIKSFLDIGQLKNIQFKITENKWSGSFIWETSFWTIPLKKNLSQEGFKL